MSRVDLELGSAFTGIVAELGAWRFGPESFATCADCAMKPRVGAPPQPHRAVFGAAARCCTYHPDLPNFLAGRALRRGGIGAEKIAARLAVESTRYPEGIVAPPEVEQQYRRRGPRAFGTRDDLTCPYWVPGPHGCAIHADRNAVCRTWHCKSVDGAKGHAAWTALRGLLIALESDLAQAVVVPGAPPREAPLADWVAWYVACADRVDALSPEALRAMRTARIERFVTAVGEAVAAREAPLPEVVAPSVAQWFHEPDRIALTAWSAYDLVDAPKWIFQLLGRLDGKRTWRQAKAETEAAIGESIPDDLIHTLHRRGLLSPPEPMTGAGVSFRLHDAPGHDDERALKQAAQVAETLVKALTPPTTGETRG